MSRVEDLVGEFLPLNRRRLRGEPALSVEELARWSQLREMLEHAQTGAGAPVGESRRLQLRVASHLKVSFAAESQRAGQIRDLSLGGLFIECASPLPPGSPLELEIDAGQGDSLRGEARVVWVRDFDNLSGPAGMGVAFVELDTAQAEALNRLVEGVLHELAVQPEAPAAAPAHAEDLPPYEEEELILE